MINIFFSQSSFTLKYQTIIIIEIVYKWKFATQKPNYKINCSIRAVQNKVATFTPKAYQPS